MRSFFLFASFSAIAVDQHGKTYEKDSNLMILPLDLREFSTHEELTKQIINRFQRIDVLVNNAGRAQRSWVHETSLDIERELMDLNFVGTISLTKAVLPYMMGENSGQIVVVSSLMGKFGGYIFSDMLYMTDFLSICLSDSLYVSLSDCLLDECGMPHLFYFLYLLSLCCLFFCPIVCFCLFVYTFFICYCLPACLFYCLLFCVGLSASWMVGF